MNNLLSDISHKYVLSIPAAMKALDAMERELTQASTYDHLRMIVNGAQAIKKLASDVEDVKRKAEDTILAASVRIGDELQKVPKATGKKNLPDGANSKASAMPSGTSRARYQALAMAGENLKGAVERLRSTGKDASVSAVVRELRQATKADKRTAREADLAIRISALPEKRYGVIYADPPWRFEPYSRETGMDRSADNHYPTGALDQIKSVDVASIAADDCVLFLWATAPMLPQALDVMEAWGFEYRSGFVWVKDRMGTGYWNRNQHENLLVGVKGDIPAPSPGTQWPSLIEAPIGKHSEKPEEAYELIECYFPKLPKIELYARAKRDGWDRFGNEA